MNQVHQITPTSFVELNQALNSRKQNTDFLLPQQSVLPIEANACQKMPLILSNTDYTNHKNIAVLLDGMENITLDFNHSVLECCGQLQPLTLLNSQNITIKNLIIDWAIPLSAEGTILTMTEHELVLQINAKLFPFELKNDRLFFLGNGEPASLWSAGHTVFHPDTKAVCMKNGDELWLEKCELVGDNIVRFTGNFSVIYPVGSVIVLRHSKRVHAGIFVENCRNIRFENVTIHATGGLGILCQFNENLTFQKVSFRANTKKGRQIVNGHDDGLHLTSNRGKILVEDCYFHGLMDDPINVHGLCTRIEEIIDTHTVKGRYMHPQAVGFQQFAKANDLFSVIHSSSMASIGTLHAEKFTLLDKDTFILTFSKALPSDTKPGDALENLTNTAAFTCKNNYFGSCRARGILVSTPKPVLIEHNLFQSAGSAILIAGDANNWYESGACHDVSIVNNSFAAECLATPYQGCNGIISICPEIPNPDSNLPFHRNILLEDNTFFSTGVPVVYALSTLNLKIRQNRIFRCKGYSAASKQALIMLDACSQVVLEQNTVSGEFDNPLLSIQNTADDEIICDIN